MIFVDKPYLRVEEDHSVLSTQCHALDGTHTLWYKTSAEINPTADIFLISTLIPAMKLGENLHVKGDISAYLLQQINTIQDILHCWYPELKKIEVKYDSLAPNSCISDRKVACFFSGGVDSFYTLLKHIDEITTIVYIRGFDVDVDEITYLDMMSRQVKKMAAELGKELIEVETNIHVFSDKYVDWSYHYHGSALASVASLLSGQISKIYIPSSYNYKNIFPWGTHPLLDNLWSTERVEIIHDGCEASRIQKIKKIISNNCVLNHLRVCTDRTSGRYNCSNCEKCIRTMLSLYALGCLSKCITFPKELDMASISKLVYNDHTLIFANENFNALPEGQIKEALKTGMDNFIK